MKREKKEKRKERGQEGSGAVQWRGCSHIARMLAMLYRARGQDTSQPYYHPGM